MSWSFDAKDVERWGKDPASRAHLPNLIRRLIFGYTDDLKQNDFPGGSGVDGGGWDGIVEAGKGNVYVPVGQSGWEVSTSKSPEAKATGDFKKRAEDPLELDAASTTFVFVTTRVWSNKRKWIQSHKEDSTWRDVRAYDAEDLAAWLEQVPTEAVWFAEQIGRPVDLAKSIVDTWRKYAEAKNPPLTPEALLAGRKDDRKRFVEWLRDEPGVIQIQADSEGEAVAFAAACIESLDEDDRDHHRSRTVFLERPEAWSRLRGRRKGLLVLISGAHSDLALTMHREGSHVALATARSYPAGGNAISLSRPSRQDFQQAIESLGLDERRAERLAREAGRSIGTLRRQLMPVRQKPEWLKPGQERALIPALLAGSWDENEERYADRQVLEALADRPYGELIDTLTSLEAGPEPPLRRVDTVWSLTAPLEAFSVVAPYLRRDDCQRLKRAITTVLSDEDPTLELPVDQRWAAEMYNKQRRYSGRLRAGLIEALVLLSVVEERTNLNLGARAQDFVSGIVMDLFRHDSSENIWLLLRNELSMLAEAAPEAFLTVVEDALDDELPPIVALFDDQNASPLFGTPSHTSLLWALEKLAWNPDFLTQVSLILARLAELDPGGRWANRPMSSLREIFVPSLWQTSANFEQRLSSLGSLLQHHPNIGRTLHLNLLPKSGGWAVTPNVGPRWRDWDHKRHAPVLREDHRAFIIAIRTRLIELATAGKQHWPSILRELASFSPEDRSEICSKLENLDEEAISTDLRKALWAVLKEFVTHHRQFPTAHWALPAQEIDRLEELEVKFAPLDSAQRHRDLFSHSPKLRMPRMGSLKEQDDAMREAQRHVVEDLLDVGDIQAITNFAQTVEPLTDLVGLSPMLAFRSRESGS